MSGGIYAKSSNAAWRSAQKLLPEGMDWYLARSYNLGNNADRAHGFPYP